MRHVGDPGYQWRRLGARLLMAAGLAAAIVPASARAAGPLVGQTIVIDPGHGGTDGGAAAFGRVEKSVTLPIGLDLSAVLRSAGARVVLTRSSDAFVSLAERAAIANAAGSAIFVSIHANALSDPTYSGLTTYAGPSWGYVTGVTRSPGLVAASQALAADVQAATQARTGAVDHGVQSATYYVLGNARIPAVLIETGFLTNPAEGQRLATPAYQQTLAAGIANGLARFAARPGQSPPALGAAAGGALVPAAPAALQYRVRPGDTLSALAVHFGVTEAALRSTNALGNADLLIAGETLTVPLGLETAAPTVAPVGAVDGAGIPSGGAYAVQQGDTLSGIAQRLGVPTATLAQANGVTNADQVFAGQSLHLPGGGPAATVATPSTVPAAAPGGRRYLVRAGDTLWGIALRLGLREQDLAAANHLLNTSRLVAGQYLRLP